MRTAKPILCVHALKSVSRLVFVLTVFGYAFSPRASAQEVRLPQGGPLPDYAKALTLPADREAPAVIRNGLPNVMITGYWPPTNEMIRRFSPDPIQNPDGWIGEDWEGRGYNVYAYFPEFPHGLGKGEGDFEVDYQDTSQDFWLYTGQIEPVAIITTGRAGDDTDWEVEWRHRNLACLLWTNDYLDPLKPTPCPPDESQPGGYIRYSSLPMQQIADAVNDAGLDVNAFVDTSSYGGNFLCEFIGYHANWYHELHADPDDPLWLVAGGHIHVGSLVELADAVEATEITLRTLIGQLDARMLCPGDLDADGYRNVTDFTAFAGAYSSQRSDPNYNPAADLDGDGYVNVTDFTVFAGYYLVPCPS